MLHIILCSILLRVKNGMSVMDRTYSEKRTQLLKNRGYDPHYSETFIKDDRKERN